MSPGEVTHVRKDLAPVPAVGMSTAQLAAVSFLARYPGRTHTLAAYQLKRWFDWCEINGLDPLVGVQRAHSDWQQEGGTPQPHDNAAF